EEVRRVAEQPAEASALVRADGEGVRVRRQLELDVGRRRESGGVAARLLLRGQGVLRVREPDLHLDPLRARHRAAVERLLVDGDGALERADRARLLRERLLEILRRDLLRDELAERAEPADRRLRLADRDAEVEERVAVRAARRLVLDALGVAAELGDDLRRLVRRGRERRVALDGDLERRVGMDAPV